MAADVRGFVHGRVVHVVGGLEAAGAAHTARTLQVLVRGSVLRGRAQAEVLGAELRIYTKVSGTFRISETDPVDVQLLSCHDQQLLDSRTLDLQDSHRPKWEVLDVWEIFKERQHLSRGRPFCLELRAMLDNPERELDLQLLGGREKSLARP